MPPIRLRLSGFTDTDIRLSCGTAGDGSEGLWYGRLAIRWPEDCGYETEGDRILVQADSIIECEAMEVSFRVEGTDSIGFGHCPPSATNILPITSLSGYDVMTNHVPDIKLSPNHYGPNCPETTTLDIWAGYAHGGEKPWGRNFETIPTGSAEDDETSHCHAIDWSENLEIDIEEYLPDWLLDYKDKLQYRANRTFVDGTKIKVSEEETDDLLPDIYHVEVCKEHGVTLDRLWI